MPNGLVQQAQQPQPQIEGTPEEAESNLTAEEQTDYEAAMEMTGEIIYTNDESSQALIELMSEDDPVAGVVEASMFVLSQIEQAYQGNFPEQLILPVMDEITDMLLELGETAELFTVDEQMAVAVKGGAAEELVAEYGADPAAVEANLGDITETEVSEMSAMFGGQNG